MTAHLVGEARAMSEFRLQLPQRKPRQREVKRDRGNTAWRRDILRLLRNENRSSPCVSSLAGVEQADFVLAPGLRRRESTRPRLTLPVQFAAALRQAARW